jgi:hypothetical protein
MYLKLNSKIFKVLMGIIIIFILIASLFVIKNYFLVKKEVV